VDAEAFRAEFPVLETIAYLNAGTDGPLPRRSVEAAEARFRRELERGRSGALHFLEVAQLAEELRTRLARLLNAEVDEIALTRSTTAAVNVVLAGLTLGPEDEVLTSDEEHPGLLAPLAALHRRTGAAIRLARFDDLPLAASERTRLVAVSHVSWMRGAVAALDALRESGVPLLLDGAQALGAVPVDVRALGCDYYAASGQKWLCGPDWTGCLYVRAERIETLGMPVPNYMTLADPKRPLALVPNTGARRFDGGLYPGPAAAAALESVRLLEEAGWEWLFERSATQAAKLRELLAPKAELVPGGPTTLVSWRSENPDAAVERLAAAGVMVRSIPGRPWLRASVGAWSSDADLERLARRSRPDM
jgi:selenocysteine lyase/cysteine desulfurase